MPTTRSATACMAIWRSMPRTATILDIGCGSGNTGTEMAPIYQSYLGVDISEAALAKASKRSEECGRGSKNHFECGDFLTYAPSGQYDVILFRESMYHVPLGKVKATLDRYSVYLKDGGVFVVRLFASSADRPNGKDKQRPAAMLSIMEAEFDVIEKARYDVPGQPTVMVFRPKVRLKNSSDSKTTTGFALTLQVGRDPASAGRKVSQMECGCSCYEVVPRR